MLVTKDDKLNIINEANNHTEKLSQIREACENTTQFYDRLESCVSFLEKFNYRMNQLWNDSKKQIDKIGTR